MSEHGLLAHTMRIRINERARLIHLEFYPDFDDFYLDEHEAELLRGKLTWAIESLRGPSAATGECPKEGGQKENGG